MTALKPFKVDSRIFNRHLFGQVLDLWFADLPRSSVAPNRTRILKWFGAGDQATRQAFDDACRSKSHQPLDLLGPASINLPKFTTFENERANAVSIASPFLELNELKGDDIDAKAEGVLSLILLFDQLSRNTFRDRQDVIYAHYDRLSRALTHCILNSKEDNPIFSIDKRSFCRLSPPYRIWLYMPLMHSEDLKDHEELRRIVFEMRTEQQGSDAAVEYIDSLFEFELKHRKILEQFGRYPHRNAILGRDPTSAEREWLKEGGDTFGTG
ncbi:MAG: hypothetical protein M1822_007635 [Bathelium mastoideum]|nr:MAG: hypothetical protein M1822_007635 [Bathelium mastoideum]